MTRFSCNGTPDECFNCPMPDCVRPSMFADNGRFKKIIKPKKTREELSMARAEAQHKYYLKRKAEREARNERSCIDR